MRVYLLPVFNGNISVLRNSRDHGNAASDCVSNCTLFYNMDFHPDLFHGCPLPSALESSIMSLSEAYDCQPVSDRDVFQEWKEAAWVSSPPQDSGKADCQSASWTKTSQPFKFMTARLQRLLVSPLQVCAQAAIVERIQIFKNKWFIQKSTAINDNNKIRKEKKKCAGPEATAHNEIFLLSWVSM